MTLWAFVLASAAHSFAADAPTCPQLKWKELSTAWQAYMDKGSAVNGKKVLALVPVEAPVGTHCDGFETTREQIFHGYRTMKARIERGDTLAMIIALRITSTSDGGDAETLNYVAGLGSHDHARSYLKAVLAAFNGSTEYCPGVASYDDVYADDGAAKLQDLKVRQAGVAAVKDTKVAAIRKRCLDVLNDALARFNK